MLTAIGSVRLAFTPQINGRKPLQCSMVILWRILNVRALSLIILQAIAAENGRYPAFFNDKLNKPMALLRGNFYPKRPFDSGDEDFGIAEHTDYGCLTFLVTDGQQGLEVQLPDGRWQAVQVPSGEFIINFGEMLEFWTGGEVKSNFAPGARRFAGAVIYPAIFQSQP